MPQKFTANKKKGGSWKKLPFHISKAGAEFLPGGSEGTGDSWVSKLPKPQGGKK